MMNLPNALTLSRIFLTPVALWCYSAGYIAAAFSVLFWCLVTDFFDGYFARKLNCVTPLGGLLDPVADKVVVLSCYGFILAYLPEFWWYTLLLYLRNISQLLSIPILSWWLKKEFFVKPKWPAKWATALSFALIPVFLISALRTHAEAGLEGNTQLFLIVPLVISAFLEFYIFVTYVPRLLAIAQGRHDTFE